MSQVEILVLLVKCHSCSLKQLEGSDLLWPYGKELHASPSLLNQFLVTCGSFVTGVSLLPHQVLATAAFAVVQLFIPK